jgi:hypothetical protein
MAFSLVGTPTTVFANITTPQAVTVPATTVGNTLVVVVQFDSNRTLTSVTGGAAGNYDVLHTEGPVSGTWRAAICAAVCTTSVTSITVTLSANAAGGTNRITFMEFSGGAASITEEGTSTGSSNDPGTTTHNAATITPSGSEVLFIGCVGISGSAGTWTEDADFTAAFSTVGSLMYVAYRIQSGSSAAQSFTVSTSNARFSAVAFAALAGASAGGATPAPGAGTLVVGGQAPRMGFTINMPAEP